MSKPKMPTYSKLVAAILQSLVERGGTARSPEILKDVSKTLELSEETLAVPATWGRYKSEVARRASRARRYLRRMDAVENPRSGTWVVTEQGRTLHADGTAGEVFFESFKAYYGEKADADMAIDFGLDRESTRGDAWKTRLLDVLREMPPDAFERLCQRILRDKGFTKVRVTGETHDGGIDGVGVLSLNLISFHVVFQCKRYTGSVGVGAIRDFRGSMMGRADKGLFLTTGHFTAEAEREAVRDGAAAIDLIDGNELCDLLKELKLGVKTKMVEEVTIEPAFFASSGASATPRRGRGAGRRPPPAGR